MRAKKTHTREAGTAACKYHSKEVEGGASEEVLLWSCRSFNVLRKSRE